MRFWLVILAFVVAAGLALALVWSAFDDEEAAPIVEPGIGMIRDRLVHLTDFSTGEARGVVAGDVVTLGEVSGYPRTGTWTSPAYAAGRPLREVLPSWAVDAPAGTGVRFSGRVRVDGAWSPWLDFGYWGEVPPPREPEVFEHGAVAIDILELNRPAEAWQVRARLFAFDLHATPTIERISVAMRSGGERPDAGRASWSGDVVVPFVPQSSGGPQIKREICSPTSVAMAAAAFGVETDVRENAVKTFDREHGIFGNWNRAVARANELGVRPHLERFTTWEQVARHLRDNRVIVASHNFAAGEAPSFLMDATAGHLFVVRGLTPGGDVIVNDPASAGRGEAAVLARADVERAWFENAGGVGYVIGPAAE
jgi:hypothetical protein